MAPFQEFFLRGGSRGKMSFEKHPPTPKIINGQSLRIFQVKSIHCQKIDLSPSQVQVQTWTCTSLIQVVCGMGTCVSFHIQLCLHLIMSPNKLSRKKNLAEGKEKPLNNPYWSDYSRKRLRFNFPVFKMGIWGSFI